MNLNFHKLSTYKYFIRYLTNLVKRDEVFKSYLDNLIDKWLNSTSIICKLINSCLRSCLFM